MRTSLNELTLMEDFLLSNVSDEDKVLMQARLVLQPELQESMYLQQKTYRLVNSYGREKLQKEITQVHQKLFTAAAHLSFRRKIMRFFKR